MAKQDSLEALRAHSRKLIATLPDEECKRCGETVRALDMRGGGICVDCSDELQSAMLMGPR